jgi:hypothetical protein
MSVISIQSQLVEIEGTHDGDPTRRGICIGVDTDGDAYVIIGGRLDWESTHRLTFLRLAQPDDFIRPNARPQ